VTATPDLHPAQNRGLRELVATRHLADHWGSLAQRLGAGTSSDSTDRRPGGSRTAPPMRPGPWGEWVDRKRSGG
jgi:hypothetical protein